MARAQPSMTSSGARWKIALLISVLPPTQRPSAKRDRRAAEGRGQAASTPQRRKRLRRGSGARHRRERGPLLEHQDVDTGLRQGRGDTRRRRRRCRSRARRRRGCSSRALRGRCPLSCAGRGESRLLQGLHDLGMFEKRHRGHGTQDPLERNQGGACSSAKTRNATARCSRGTSPDAASRDEGSQRHKTRRTERGCRGGCGWRQRKLTADETGAMAR